MIPIRFTCNCTCLGQILSLVLCPYAYNEESVTLFSQGNFTTKKPASILSKISFHQGRLLPAPLRLGVIVVMMGQLEAAWPCSLGVWAVGSYHQPSYLFHNCNISEGSVIYTSDSQHTLQIQAFFLHIQLFFVLFCFPFRGDPVTYSVIEPVCIVVNLGANFAFTAT